MSLLCLQLKFHRRRMPILMCNSRLVLLKVKMCGMSTTELGLFSAKNESKEPITLIGLSTVKSGMSFFNTNTGGRIFEEPDVSFQYVDIKKITGVLKWIQEPRTLFIGELKTPKEIREGVFTDGTGHMPITLWCPHTTVTENICLTFSQMVVQHKFGTKLTNTVLTTVIPSSADIKVDWEKTPLAADFVDSIVCCPDAVSVKTTEYKCCVNISFQKKVIPFPGETTVKCNNPTCRRKMKVSRCKSTFTILGYIGRC